MDHSKFEAFCLLPPNPLSLKIRSEFDPSVKRYRPNFQGEGGQEFGGVLATLAKAWEPIGLFERGGVVLFGRVRFMSLPCVAIRLVVKVKLALLLRLFGG